MKQPLNRQTWSAIILAAVAALCPVSIFAQANQSSTLPNSQVNPDRLMAITQSADPSYVLSPNDFIQIAVFQEDDLNTATRISKSGTIDFPLIGTIQLGGITVAKSTALIRAKLMDGYIRDPQVSVTVIEFAKRRYTVMGEVQHPGTYEMPQQEGVTLLQAISNAGGYSKIADKGKVTVKRVVDGKEQVYQLNAKTMAQDSNVKQFTIEPGDTITVAESLF